MVIKMNLFKVIVFGISQVHTSKPIDQSVANHAKEKIIAKEDITDVKAVNTDKELMAAIKVENFSKIRLRKKISRL
nr:hypothetical protein P5648_10485 [Bacillus subtilis]